MMADDLVFPPPDPLSFIDDFDSNILQNENSINSLNSSLDADLHSSLLQSDLLHIPPLLPANTLSPTEQKMSLNTVPEQKLSINSPLPESYTPISQLMKQTEQLSKTLESPLASSNMVFGAHNSQATKGLVNNNAGSFNQMNNSPTHLVVGGQQMHVPSPNSMSTMQNNLLSIENQQQAMIKQQLMQQQLQLQQQQQHHRLPLILPVQKSPLQTNVPQIHNMNKPGNMSPVNSDVSLMRNNHLQNNVNLKTSQEPREKSSLKGQFVKTSDQRLMFVTEVDGRRVAYYIQHSSNNPLPPTQTSPFSSSPSMFMSTNSVHVNNSPLVNQVLSSSTTSTINTVQSKPLLTKPTNEEIENTNKMEEPSKKQEKSIRDKFLDFRNVISQKPPQLIGPKPHQLNSQKSPQLIGQKPTSGVVSYLKEKQEELSQSSENSPNEHIKTISQTDNIDDEDDEDGQEIEFSENDISLNPDEHIESPIVESNPSYTNQQSTDDEESVPLSYLKSENSNEHSITAHEIIKEELQVQPEVKEVKVVKKRSESNDTLPLSVVAANLKKDDDKSKKKGKKGKKKKKDERQPKRPLLAYQVFFRDVQSTLREDNPQLSFGELSKLIAQMWEKLEDDKKKLYQDEYHEKKKIYEQQMIEYKELLAKEALVTSPTPVSPSDETPSESTLTPLLEAESSLRESSTLKTGEDELESESVSLPVKNTTSKKTTKKAPRKKVKKNTPRLTKVEVDESNENDEPMEVNEPLDDVPESPKEIPSSPSLPSSDSSSEESDEDETISRMKKKAEELKKKIKIEKKAVSKSKASRESKRSTRVTRMEVETISKTETLIVNSQNKSSGSSPGNSPKRISPPPPTVPSSATSPKSLRSDVKPTRSENPLSLSKLKSLRMKTSNSDVMSSLQDTVDQPPPNKMAKKTDSFSPPQPVASLPKSTFKIPKKSGAGSNPSSSAGPRLCIRNNCGNPAKSTRERGAQYCSNDCLVIYCREQFDSWVLDRQKEEENT